ncbi:Hnrnpu [Symbiodinium pilosum]|uniref:Hnrnpu protein n=1 Tax=Symbiodinium pilosum TaxID=2952 RepID=A0A812QV98_SYMPI|nr:Hnrnpu [Symbiodinium pilosum]
MLFLKLVYLPLPTEQDEFEEEEDDASDHKKPKIKGDVDFLTPDLTLDALPCMGNKVLMSINEGGLQYMISGARANVGLKAGRYMFEFKIVETYHTTETYNSKLRGMRQLVRVGFSTAGSPLILGESDSAVYFDNDGNFVTGRARAPRVVQKFARDQGMAVVLNLDPKSPHANTISLFTNGVRACKPQKLPENLIGKPLFPHISYRHMSVMVNFGKKAFTKMPFVCRTIADAATADVKVETPPKDGKCEVIMPVAFPDEGTFDWLDSFLEEKPTYTELSDRRIQEWAVSSGLPRPKPGAQASNDKPYYMYGLPSLDDTSTQKAVSMLAPMQPRNYVVMEVKSNLIKEDRTEGNLSNLSEHLSMGERAQVLKRFPSTHFKKEYKKRVRNKILKAKQDKADSTWRIKKAQQEQKKRMAARQKELEAARKQAEENRKKMEEEAKKAKEKEEGSEEKKEEKAEEEAEAKEPAEKPDEEMKKEEEPAPEEEEDLGDEPPKAERVELTEEEEKMSFLPKGAVPDLTASVLGKAFANFTIPEKDEGFDEIKFIWQGAGESAFLAGRAAMWSDLQPSQDFKDKFGAWQKTYGDRPQGKIDSGLWRGLGFWLCRSGCLNILRKLLWTLHGIPGCLRIIHVYLLEVPNKQVPHIVVPAPT